MDRLAIKHPTTWTEESGTHTVAIGGSVFRVVEYPDTSSMAGKFGVYRDGRYKAVFSTLSAAKAQCLSLATRRRGTINFSRHK